MKTEILLFISIVLTLIGCLLIYIKLKTYLWDSNTDYLLTIGIIILLITGLLTLVTVIKTTIDFYLSQRFTWSWLLSLLLAASYLLCFIYYLIKK